MMLSFPKPSTLFSLLEVVTLSRGLARIFQSEGTHQIVTMAIVIAFSPPVVGCLVKKGLQKGGHGHPRTPPWLRP